METRKLIVGNWKMHTSRAEAVALAHEVASWVREHRPQAEVGICPPFLWLEAVYAALESGAVALGAQDCHAELHGAFTGEVSAEMLADAGCRYVILGHSERREYHQESDAQVRHKALAAYRAGLTPVICVGESLTTREAGRTLDWIGTQIRGSIPETSAGTPIIAYEPIWAIGSGKIPTLDEVTAAHAEIHRLLTEAFGFAAGAVRVLYGGSVKPANAAALLALPGVNGALVGGASLEVDAFTGIIAAGN